MEHVNRNQPKSANRVQQKRVKVVEGKAHAVRFDRIDASLLNKVMRRKNQSLTKVLRNAVKFAYLAEFGGKRELT